VPNILATAAERKKYPDFSIMLHFFKQVKIPHQSSSASISNYCMNKITFANKKNIFIKTLKGKVDDYFATTGVHSSGSIRLYLKSMIQLSSA
jgi:hypothetical protein